MEIRKINLVNKPKLKPSLRRELNNQLIIKLIEPIKLDCFLKKSNDHFFYKN